MGTSSVRGKRKQAVKQAIDNTSSGSDAESAGVNNVGQSGTISFKGRELDIKMPANRGPVSSQPKRRFHSLGSRKKPGWETRRAKRKRASVGAKKGFKCGFCHTPGHKLPSCQNIHKIGDLININELGSVEEINPNTAKVTAVDAHSTSIPTRHVPALLVCARTGSGKDMLLQVKTLGKWDPAKQTCPVSSTLWVSQATIRQWLTKGRRLFKIRSKPEISEWYDEKEFFKANGLLRKEVHVTRKGCHSKLTKQHVCYEIDWVDYKASWNDEAYCKHWFPDWVSQFGPNND